MNNNNIKTSTVNNNIINDKNTFSIKFIMLIDLMFKGTVKVLSYSFLINPLNLSKEKENILINYNVCDTIILHVNPNNLFSVLKFVKQSTFLSYNSLIDIVCIDETNHKNFNSKLLYKLYNSAGNFVLQYVLRSYVNETKLIVKTRLNSFDFNKTNKPLINSLKLIKLKKNRYNDLNVIDSVTSLFMSAGWLEREIFDMFGIIFSGNLDIRRILNDYSFVGHPLLKSFPMTGFNEMSYKAKENIINFNNVTLIKEYVINKNKLNWA